MTSKIFRSIFATSLVVLAATLAIITTFLYDYFTSIQIDQLKDELSCLYEEMRETRWAIRV